jgi:hypothetical protein
MQAVAAAAIALEQGLPGGKVRGGVAREFGLGRGHTGRFRRSGRNSGNGFRSTSGKQKGQSGYGNQQAVFHGMQGIKK